VSWNDKYKAYLASLNDWQREVVDALCDTNTRQPLRVVAAAGSGKTRTTIAATAKIINEEIVAPNDLMVTTFTRKAAGELKKRLTPLVEPRKLGILLGEGRALPRLGTFHSICVASLRRQDVRWQYAGVDDRGRKKFTGTKQDARAPDHLWDRGANIDGDKDNRRSVTIRGQSVSRPSPNAIYRFVVGPPTTPWGSPIKPESKLRVGLPGFEPLDLIDPDDPYSPSYNDYKLAVGILRSYGFTPDNVLEKDQGVELVQGFEYDGLEEIIEVWKAYNLAKKNLQAFDFEDILYAYWQRSRDKAKLVIVDEAQDNSAVQLGIAERVAGRGKGRFALVGDVRQAIYSWRGAVPKIMATIDQTHRATTKEIPTNYRSGRLIVALGNRVAINPVTGEPEEWSVGSASEAARRDVADLVRTVRIGDNEYAYAEEPDPWRPGTEQPTGAVRVATTRADPLDEAEAVGDEIIQMLEQDVSPKDLCVLVRTNAVGALFELGLIKRRVPVMRLGSDTSFFDRRSVADAFAWAALAYEDDTEDLRRVFNKPKRPGIFITGTDKYLKGAGKGTGAIAALRHLSSQHPRSAAAYGDLIQTIEGLRAKAKEEDGWAKVLLSVSAFLTTKDEDSKDTPKGGVDTSDDSDSELLDAFFGLAKGFDSFTELRRWSDLLRDPKNVRSYSEREMDNWTEEQKAEFEEERKKRVVISTIHKSKGLEWRFVWVTASSGVFPHARSSAGPRLEEEKRLFYVAVTRAADVVTITSAAETLTGKEAGPSPFIGDYVIPLLAEEGYTRMGVPKVSEDAPPTPSAPPPEPVGPRQMIEAAMIDPWEIAMWDGPPGALDGFMLALPNVREGGNLAEITVLPDGDGYSIEAAEAVKGIIPPPHRQKVWAFHQPDAKTDVLRTVQNQMQVAVAWLEQQGIGEPTGPSGKPYQPPPTSPPPGSVPQPPPTSATEAEWAAFLGWIRSQPGEIQPGLTWARFAKILADRKAEVMGAFRAARAAGMQAAQPSGPSAPPLAVSAPRPSAQPAVGTEPLSRLPAWVEIPKYGAESTIHGRTVPGGIVANLGTDPATGKEKQVRVNLTRKADMALPALVRLNSIVMLGEPDEGYSTFHVYYVAPAENPTPSGDTVIGATLVPIGSVSTRDGEGAYRLFWQGIAREANARWRGDALEQALDRGNVTDPDLRWKARVLFEGSVGQPVAPSNIGGSAALAALNAGIADSALVMRDQRIRDVGATDLAALERAGVLTKDAEGRYRFAAAPSVESLRRSA
jgi:superfamily I DNA/RNA helicase